jgi:hypothetical protein
MKNVMMCVCVCVLCFNVLHHPTWYTTRNKINYSFDFPAAVLLEIVVLIILLPVDTSEPQVAIWDCKCLLYVVG